MNIACIGNVVYDFVVFTDKFVKENTKASYSKTNVNTGGPACNAACILNRYGNHVDFYGQIGKDGFGKEVYSKLCSEGLNLNYLAVSEDIMTPFSFVIVNTENASRTINSVRSPQDLENAKINNFSYRTDYDYILTDGKYAEDSISLIRDNPKAISIIDAGRWDEGILKLCENVDFIICSEEFASNVTGIDINHNYLNDAKVYNKLKERFPDVTGIAITVGKYGYIYEEDGIILNIPCYDPGMPSIDTNCAGDIFHAAFTHALAQGKYYPDALEFANVVASISTTRVGGKDSCPSLDEVNHILNDLIRKRKI